MAIVGVELEKLVSQQDALTTRPPMSKADALTDSSPNQMLYFQVFLRILSQVIKTN